MIELVDRRVLGGFICVDSVTGSSLTDPLVVTAPGLSLVKNRSGVYAILDAPNLDGLTTQFVPSEAWPSPAAFEIAIEDPSLRYLPRRASIQIPQPLATIAHPQTIVLYPAASAPVAPNWAIVRASVVNAASTGAGLPWAALQIVRTSDEKPIATGVADARGEALLALYGLARQTSSSSSGPVTETTLAVTVTAWFAPSVLSEPTGWIPNPDDIFGNLSNPALKSASVSEALAPGLTVTALLQISV
jgi:hypothetical protein